MKKISIITVNLNNLDGLKKTAHSVFSQNFKDFEFIIIDGNSNDGSKEYIEGIGSKLTIYLSEADTGIYNAMNKGIRIANGEYIYFLNSGDVFHDNNTLKNVTSKMTDPNIGLYYGNLIYNWPQKQELITFPKKLTYPFFVIDNINHQACFIKRQLFDDIFYYNEDYKIISDWEFLMYAICKVEISYRHLEMLIAIYDTSGISTDLKNRAAIYADKDDVLEKHFSMYLYSHDDVTLLMARRTQDYIHIRKNRVAFRFLKWFMSLLLIFLPKVKYVSKFEVK